MKAMNVQDVTEYLISNYGFEITPCSIPENDWEHTKLDFYVMIKRKMFWLFRTLMRLSPIKRLEERPDGSVWLEKRLNSGLCEIELLPDYESNTNVRIMYSDINMNAQVIDNHEEAIEKLFYLIPELRMMVRHRRLNSLTETE